MCFVIQAPGYQLLQAAILPVVLTADDLSEELLGRVPEEGRAAHQELVQDDPHGPPVHRLAVALPQDHLRGDVLRCTAHLATHSKKFLRYFYFLTGGHRNRYRKQVR